MRKTVIRTFVVLAAAAAASTALLGSPAYAEPRETSGLTFYEGTFGAPVLHLAKADGICRPFPATAGSLAASQTVTQVLAYRSADCTASPVGLGTLRGFPAGEFLSFQAL
jgi:hypothetical protein